jgi:hypothetical protein
MGNRYEGRIKVVPLDMLCFPVDAATLKPLGCECYDPYAYIHPTPGAVEVISIGEWYRRRDERDVKQRWPRPW